MYRAIEVAKSADKDIKVGAVIIKDGKVIASACNKKEVTSDVTAHAEIVAIRQAEEKLGNWRLDDCEMYVTLEPCPMCAWAILQSRIKALYFGSYDRNYGAFGSAMDLRKFSNTDLKVYGGIMEAECDKILEDCFKDMRDDNGKRD